MGTDIHLYVERQQPDGTWQLVPPPEPPPASERTEKCKNHQTGEEYDYVSPFWGPHCCMYDPGPPDDDSDPEEAQRSKMYRMRWYQNRNYDVFAILTGTVRDGHGFASVPTSSGFNGITKEPRGVPNGTERRYELASWDHSKSWLGLSEILAFDWDQVTTHTGVIPMRSEDEPNPWGGKIDPYCKWHAREPRVAPISYSGSISGRGIETISAEHADRMLRSARDGLTIDSRTRWFVQVTWEETYRTSAEDFLAFVDQMLVPLGDPAQTRIVFGFDS